ncbi:MAG: hypothetical protein J4G18_01060 [Anaerolineae bacterium]|nr:hypothetical protein [Anaerolineae bacterium]
MSEVLALYRIQQLELEIIDQTKRIKAIDLQLEDNAGLHEAEAAFETAKVAFDEAVKRANEMSLEIAALIDKKQNSETRLYSGEVTNPKEMQDLQMEIESLARRNDVLDDELARIISDRDACQATLGECESALNEIGEERKEENKNLLKEKKSLTAAVKKQLSQRKAAVKELPAELFKTYNILRNKKANRPVSVLKDDACTICGIEQNSTVITAINRSSDMVNCQSCGRILIKL